MSTLLLTLSSFAAELFFPLAQNHIKVLPQRFEYQLLDKDRFRIGDVLMDSREIGFQLLPTDSQKNHYKIRFQWPAGLLRQGELAIKDNSGKAIWLKKIDPQQVTVNDSEQHNQELRSQLATFESTENVDNILAQLKSVPFFQFCIHREEPLTRIYLCSKSLYIQTGEKDFHILSRDSYRPESFVEINGQRVSNTGLIFLNAPSEYIYLQTLLLSGATLELETRMKPVEFKDIVADEDGKTLLLRAEGAEPVNSTSVKKNSETEWETHLSIDHPYTYLKGEGDLPLRQEFMITGPVRKSSLHIFVTSAAPTETYKSQITLRLRTKPENTLATVDRRTTLEKISDTDYRWSLMDFERNSNNRRYVRITSPDGNFIGAYDIHRALSLDGELRLMTPLWTQFRLQSALGQKFSAYMNYDQQMLKSPSEPNVEITTLGLMYRTSAGEHMDTPAFGPSLDIATFQTNIKNTYLVDAGIFAELHSPGWYNNWFPWTLLRARIPVASTDSQYKLKSAWDVEFSLRRFIADTAYIETGLRSQQYLFRSSDTTLTQPEIKSSRAFLFFGLGALF